MARSVLRFQDAPHVPLAVLVDEDQTGGRAGRMGSREPLLEPVEGLLGLVAGKDQHGDPDRDDPSACPKTESA